MPLYTPPTLKSLVEAAPEGETFNLMQNSSGITSNIPLSSNDVNQHAWNFAINGTNLLEIVASGDGAGGLTGREVRSLGTYLIYGDLSLSGLVPEAGGGRVYATKGYFSGNVLVGGVEAGTNANYVIALSNAATPPSDTADLVQLYAVDLSAGSATLGIVCERAVAADAALASTHSLTVKINGSNYKIALVAA